MGGYLEEERIFKKCKNNFIGQVVLKCQETVSKLPTLCC